ncbi:hypothetical protein METUNv1_00303 [Methyloversatilis universalis FAM5]|uniref:Uncharacterized protein n=1 Tax=Methyloversatilis universalis (strain ATCC BAA-1314 / DSM 25237 / JCM 13912 / CCUG 52030 / FAM5) TaxID=1000565 RepID=F5R7X9_METUF|nr:hypothetical protein METUNv1_00303 [Methyloversatilis universalis FAM5]
MLIDCWLRRSASVALCTFTVVCSRSMLTPGSGVMMRGARMLTSSRRTSVFSCAVALPHSSTRAGTKHAAPPRLSSLFIGFRVGQTPTRPRAVCFRELYWAPGQRTQGNHPDKFTQGKFPVPETHAVRIGRQGPHPEWMTGTAYAGRIGPCADRPATGRREIR